MTQIDVGGNEGPRTHALIIGVGHYRYLKGGAEYKSALKLRGGQLTSPPVSAKAFADWLLEPETGYNSPDAPLGTVELLISTREPDQVRYRRPDNDEVVELEPATYANVDNAFARWRDRLLKNPEAVGFFMFCGHGLELSNVALLLEDFGRDEHKEFDGAFDFDRTYTAMGRAAARRQYYFVDACRTLLVDREVEENETRPLLYPRRTDAGRPRKGGVFYATASSTEAYGERGKVSVFTSVVLDGLKGLGSKTDEDGMWVVSPGRLNNAISETLDHLGKSGQVPDQTSDARTIGTEVMHVVGDHPPPVRVVFWCKPQEADAIARLTVSRNGTEVSVRPDKCKLWETWLPAGGYVVAADFRKGAYEADPMTVDVKPPLERRALTVKERRR